MALVNIESYDFWTPVPGLSAYYTKRKQAMARLGTMSHSQRERRERIYRVCARDVADLFGRKPSGELFSWPVMDLPEGFEVLAVRENFAAKTFDFLIWHPSFSVVADGDVAPEFHASLIYEKVSFVRRDPMGKCPGCDGGCSSCSPTQIPFGTQILHDEKVGVPQGLILEIGVDRGCIAAEASLFPGDRVTLRVIRGEEYRKACDAAITEGERILAGTLEFEKALSVERYDEACMPECVECYGDKAVPRACPNCGGTDPHDHVDCVREAASAYVQKRMTATQSRLADLADQLMLPPAEDKADVFDPNKPRGGMF